jgi:hypothetical protein
VNGRFGIVARKNEARPLWCAMMLPLPEGPERSEPDRIGPPDHEGSVSRRLPHDLDRAVMQAVRPGWPVRLVSPVPSPSSPAPASTCRRDSRRVERTSRSTAPAAGPDYRITPCATPIEHRRGVKSGAPIEPRTKEAGSVPALLASPLGPLATDFLGACAPPGASELEASTRIRYATRLGGPIASWFGERSSDAVAVIADRGGSTVGVAPVG